MHSIRLTVILAIAAALTSVLPAAAATFSSPLLLAIAPQGYQCRVSNVGTSPINVSGTLYNVSGTALVPVSDGCALLGGVLPAGETCILTYGAGSVRCTVNASSSKVRVMLMVGDINGMVATVPATKK